CRKASNKCDVADKGLAKRMPDLRDPRARLLCLNGERRKNEAENDREPDLPHGHLVEGGLARSLAEGHDAHQTAARPHVIYTRCHKSYARPRRKCAFLRLARTSLAAGTKVVVRDIAVPGSGDGEESPPGAALPSSEQNPEC